MLPHRQLVLGLLRQRTQPQLGKPATQPTPQQLVRRVGQQRPRHNSNAAS
ncbi:hypothetical protein ACU686_44810 [Yinghuangia aomiensis]